MKKTDLFEKLVWSKLSRIPITQKILIIFIGCVVVPAFLQNAFYISETEANIQEQISDKMNDTLSNKASKIETTLLDTITLSIKYNNDNALYRVMDSTYSSDLEYLVTYQEHLQKRVAADLPLHLQVDSIRLYSNNPTLFNGSILRNDLDFTTEVTEDNTKFMQTTPIKVRDQPLDFLISEKYLPFSKKYERQIAIVRRLEYYPEYNQYKKAIQFELNMAYYNSLLADKGLYDNMILVDLENRVLFSGHGFSQEGVFDKFIEEDLDSGITVLKKEINGFPLILCGYYNESMISNEFAKSRMGMYFISFGSLVLSGLLITVIGNNISRRSQRIVAHASQIAKGNFPDIDFVDNGHDELAQIENSIHDMSTQLQNYIEKEYTAKLTQSKLERETTQAKLLALQGQVNPHFLFNALETIRLNSLDRPPEETSRMIKNMSKMFRHLVDWDEDIVLLKDDMKFLSEFLTIQQYRFGDEFTYTIDIDERAKSCYLPKLIIQPLVENACVHGVEAISNNKNITVTITLEENTLVFKTQDNGGGIPPQRLEKLQLMLQGKAKMNSSVGLYNVYQRLLLNYNDNFEFLIDSELGKGTTCIVKIPAEFPFNNSDKSKE